MSDILQDTPVPGVCRLTLNRPDKLNAFTYPMYAEFIEILERLRFDADARVVILTGAGRGFCSGHDIAGAGEPGWAAPDLGKAQSVRAIVSKLGEIPTRLRGLPQPVICAVNGVTAGLGYALALAADLTLAARSAKFVNAFHNAGTGHELGLSYMLPRAIGAQRAAELLLTGRPVLAKEAQAIGLILRAVDDECLTEEALALADQMLINSPIGNALTKQSMWLNAAAGSLEAAIELENRAIYISQSTEDSAERRRAFLEKRRPEFHQR